MTTKIHDLAKTIVSLCDGPDVADSSATLCSLYRLLLRHHGEGAVAKAALLDFLENGRIPDEIIEMAK